MQDLALVEQPSQVAVRPELLERLLLVQLLARVRGDVAHRKVEALREGLAKSLDEAPNESDEDAPRTFLDLAKDRWARVRLARVGAEKADVVKKAAEAAYDFYCAAADEALSMLYMTVEHDFSRYYQFVNAEDEGAFRAELVPSSGSLDLKFAFY